MSHPTLEDNRQQLVNAGAIPVLISLLSSQDADVQYYCTTALSNIAADGMLRIENETALHDLHCHRHESQEAGANRFKTCSISYCLDGNKESQSTMSSSLGSSKSSIRW